MVLKVLRFIVAVNVPLNVRDLPSFVSFFGNFMVPGDKKSTIHSFAGSNDLK